MDNEELFTELDFVKDSDPIEEDDFTEEDFDYYDEDFEEFSEVNEIPNKIDSIEFSRTSTDNYKIKSSNDIFAEAYYFEPIKMFDGTTYEKFIAGCESMIRTSLAYKAYIAYLKTELGLNRDAFNSNITDEMATLEMHHGPIFNLYDYVKIMIDYAFDVGIPVSSFNIAQLVMKEHELNNIQVVMLTKNNHSLVHAGKLNVDLRQCHGNLKEFIRKYGKYIKQSPKLLKKINRYKELLESEDFHNTSIITPESCVDWSIKENV